jgi:hypothetical protein
VKRGVVHSLVSRANVICQDRKDFNKEIKNIRRDRILNEYPQEFVDSIIKPGRSNRPFSDRTYHGTVTILCVRGISRKFRHIGNRFSVRTILKTKHTLRGTLIKIELVKGAQQTNQYVYNISCDCGRYYIGETGRPSEVHIKERKYNLAKGLLEKSKLAQHAYEEGHKIFGKKRRSCRFNLTPPTGNTRNQPTYLWQLIRSGKPAWTPSHLDSHH